MQQQHEKPKHNLKVLIVPLWNWNFCNLWFYISRESFNRTFMELKYIFHGGALKTK